MAEWEEKLPPIMREKLARIGEVTPQEKEKMKDLDRLTSLLAEFHKGELNSEGLWKELKGFKEKGKGYLLREAQTKLIDSLSLGSINAEFQRRKEGIIAIETLKKHPNTAMLEQDLNSIARLQAKYREEMEQAYNFLKTKVERNPQLRLQQVRQGQATIVMELSVDEAVRMSVEWKNFVANHEKHYSQEFARTIEKLKGEVK